MGTFGLTHSAELVLLRLTAGDLVGPLVIHQTVTEGSFAPSVQARNKTETP